MSFWIKKFDKFFKYVTNCFWETLRTLESIYRLLASIALDLLLYVFKKMHLVKGFIKVSIKSARSFYIKTKFSLFMTLKAFVKLFISFAEQVAVKVKYLFEMLTIFLRKNLYFLSIGFAFIYSLMSVYVLNKQVIPQLIKKKLIYKNVQKGSFENNSINMFATPVGLSFNLESLEPKKGNYNFSSIVDFDVENGMEWQDIIDSFYLKNSSEIIEKCFLQKVLNQDQTCLSYQIQGKTTPSVIHEYFPYILNKFQFDFFNQLFFPGINYYHILCTKISPKMLSEYTFVESLELNKDPENQTAPLASNILFFGKINLLTLFWLFIIVFLMILLPIIQLPYNTSLLLSTYQIQAYAGLLLFILSPILITRQYLHLPINLAISCLLLINFVIPWIRSKENLFVRLFYSLCLTFVHWAILLFVSI